MRVLTFLHSFEPGGVERVALRLVARWRSMGVDAPLFMGRPDGPLRSEVASNLRFEVPRQPWFGTGWWETLWMILSLPGHIRRTAPDVLFCAGNTYTVVAVAMKLILGRRCPPVVVKLSNDLVRSDMPAFARAMWRAWLRMQTRFVDRWIVMDAAILRDVATHLGAVDHTVIPDPAIDRLPVPNSARPHTAGIRYVSVGRLVYQKDHALMLSAFADAAGTGDHLTVVGDGPLRNALMRQASRLGIASQVTFAGHVPNAAASLRAYDVLLLSSRYEGVPAAMIEALAVGLRVVATDCGPGVRALAGDDRSCLLVTVGDRQGFATALAMAAAGPGDPVPARHRMREFTLDAAAPRYLGAFVDTVRRLGRDLPSTRIDRLERAA